MPARILIVDDIKENLIIAVEMVRMMGYDSISVSNGYQALDILAANNIQLALIDWNMPEMDGIELIQRIRAQFSERYIYIIMLTARSQAEEVAEGLENGADDYVTKPFRPLELKARIDVGMRMVKLQNKMLDSLEHMENLATTDHLTGLYNRRYFLELAAEALPQYPVSCLFMVDVDHFKQVNDQYGHIAGDIVLQHIATLCRDAVGERGIFARYGGEEFIGVLLGENAKAGRQFVEHLRQLIEQTPIPIKTSKMRSLTIHITASIGLTHYDNNTPLTLENYIAEADHALYTAKESGRNQIAIE